MDAAIVELDALADAVRAAAEDDDLAAASVGSASHSGAVAALVGGIHVRRQRGEFGGAGVDALVDRAHAERGAALRDRRLAEPVELRQRASEKAHAPSAAASAPASCGRPVAPHRASRHRRCRRCAQEPRIESGRRRGFPRSRQPVPTAPAPYSSRSGAGLRERRAERVVAAVAAAAAISSKPAEPGLHGAQRLLQRSRQSCGRSPSPRRPISSRWSAAARRPGISRR